MTESSTTTANKTALQDLERALITLVQKNPDQKQNLAKCLEAVEKAPKSTILQFCLGRCYANLHDLNNAVKALETALSLSTDPALKAKINTYLSSLWNTFGYTQKALSCSNQVIDAFQDKAPSFMYVQRGNIHSFSGNNDQAVQDFNTAIACDPQNADAYYNKYLATRDIQSDDVAALDRLLSAVDPQSPSLLVTHFTRGRIADMMADYPLAFEHFSKANALRLTSCGGIDLSLIAKEVHFLKHFDSTYFEKILHQQPPLQQEDITPIFIVGMPRSGTTLLTQMLASHPEVGSVGESPIIADKTKSLLSNTPLHQETLIEDITHALSAMKAEWVLDYINYSKTLKQNKNTSWIVDKMPSNYKAIWLILALFPQAKIIYLKRHPMALGLSNYMTLFPDGNLFSYDLRALGHAQQACDVNMHHWQSCLPDSVIKVSYEHLVNNPSSELQRIVDFIGLNASGSQLSNTQNDQIIRTASMWQAREPVYTSANEKWRHYEAFLSPLKKALQEDIGFGTLEYDIDESHE